MTDKNFDGVAKYPIENGLNQDGTGLDQALRRAKARIAFAMQKSVSTLQGLVAPLVKAANEAKPHRFRSFCFESRGADIYRREIASFWN